MSLRSTSIEARRRTPASIGEGARGLVGRRGMLGHGPERTLFVTQFVPPRGDARVPVPSPAAAGGASRTGLVATATASTKAPDTVGFRSSGQSPGQSPGRPLPTLHLIGPGQVGRAFLRQIENTPVRLVAVSDSSATVHDAAGLAAGALLRHHEPIAALPGAERLTTEVAIGAVAADVVVDATAPTRHTAAEAVLRGRAALRHGACLVLASKLALAVASPEWLFGERRRRLGIDAALGGTGRRLLAQLDELRGRCHRITLVPNASTTALITAIEAGAHPDEALAGARASGVLEPDATLDLDGTDAATKLAIVAGAVFGEPFLRPPVPHEIPRQPFASLDVELLRARARAGRTTRLVARAELGGRNLRVGYEELAADDPLAVGPALVAYHYDLVDGPRCFVGDGIGPERTAAALLADVQALVEVRR